MNYSLLLPTDDERRALLSKILLKDYLDWKRFLESKFCPFGTRNQTMIVSLMEGKSFKELEKKVYTSKEALEVFFDHIIVTLEREDTKAAYKSWQTEKDQPGSPSTTFKTSL